MFLSNWGRFDLDYRAILTAILEDYDNQGILVLSDWYEDNGIDLTRICKTLYKLGKFPAVKHWISVPFKESAYVWGCVDNSPWRFEIYSWAFPFIESEHIKYNRIYDYKHCVNLEHLLEKTQEIIHEEVKNVA